MRKSNSTGSLFFLKQKKQELKTSKTIFDVVSMQDAIKACEKANTEGQIEVIAKLKNIIWASRWPKNKSNEAFEQIINDKQHDSLLNELNILESTIQSQKK